MTNNKKQNQREGDILTNNIILTIIILILTWTLTNNINTKIA